LKEPAVTFDHFRKSLKKIRPSLHQRDLDAYLSWATENKLLEDIEEIASGGKSPLNQTHIFTNPSSPDISTPPSSSAPAASVCSVVSVVSVVSAASAVSTAPSPLELNNVPYNNDTYIIDSEVELHDITHMPNKTDKGKPKKNCCIFL
jgi:hypothetical protein